MRAPPPVGHEFPEVFEGMGVPHKVGMADEEIVGRKR